MSAKTPEQIAVEIAKSLPLVGLDGRGYARYTKALTAAAREAVATQSPTAARAEDWELSTYEDETGNWVVLQTYDPEREADSKDDEQICAASLLVSDVEALDLYRALGSAIASRTPALVPEIDTESSASRQHFIDTGVYLPRRETTEATAS